MRKNFERLVYYILLADVKNSYCNIYGFQSGKSGYSAETSSDGNSNQLEFSI